MVDYVSYDHTDFLQAQQNIALCCPANLKTNSAALRYIIREHGRDAIFQLRPELGNVLSLQSLCMNGSPQVIHLLITRETPRSPIIADILFQCLERLKTLLMAENALETHFSVIDPERPLRNILIFIYV